MITLLRLKSELKKELRDPKSVQIQCVNNHDEGIFFFCIFFGKLPENSENYLAIDQYLIYKIATWSFWVN